MLNVSLEIFARLFQALLTFSSVFPLRAGTSLLAVGLPLVVRHPDGAIPPQDDSNPSLAAPALVPAPIPDDGFVTVGSLRSSRLPPLAFWALMVSLPLRWVGSFERSFSCFYAPHDCSWASTRAPLSFGRFSSIRRVVPPDRSVCWEIVSPTWWRWIRSSGGSPSSIVVSRLPFSTAVFVCDFQRRWRSHSDCPWGSRTKVNAAVSSPGVAGAARCVGEQAFNICGGALRSGRQLSSYPTESCRTLGTVMRLRLEVLLLSCSQVPSLLGKSAV